MDATIPTPGPWRPLVSVVIPTLDEERHIEACLRSVLAQDYPVELVEVIVADGGSKDRTRALVTAVATADPRVRLIDNPGRNQAAGLNRAIAASGGEVVARLDGHAEWPASHLRRCVELLEETGADNVGGTMAAVSDTNVGRAVANATRSPFGVGGARYRYGARQMETDTVFLGCFLRSALQRVGPFDERLAQHEDYELNHRIRASGGRIVFSPDVPTKYWARSSWAAVARQFYNYGSGKARVARADRGVLRPYHLVPPAAVAMAPLLVAASVTSLGRRILLAAGLAYGAACVGAAAAVARDDLPAVQLLTPVVFPVLHGAWGAGFIRGLLAKRG